MSRLILLAIVSMVLALALPGSTEATSLNEVKKLTASDAEDLDNFGQSVAVSGDTAVLGASGEDAGGIQAGAAYVVRRDQGGSGNWGEVAKLTASDAQLGDFFGQSVAVSGDIVVVGAPGFPGVAYVFQRNQGGADNWGQVAKITASDAQGGASFGQSVAVNGDTVVVGASGEDGASETLADRGAAYVFRRHEGGVDNWGEVKKLLASDADADDRFGWGVAVGGDTAVVGAWGSGGGFAGAAYVFQRYEGGVDNWGEVKRLTASDGQASDGFGISAAASGDTIVVGAGILGSGMGAYVFQRDEGGADNWGEVTKLAASDAQSGDKFGTSVAVSGDTAVVGAYAEDAGGTNAGAAYVFQRDEGGTDNWGEVTKLTASDADGRDRFGWSVAISGETAVVGALFEDAGGTDAGAAYVFDLLLLKPTPTVTLTPTVTPTPTPTLLPGVGGIALNSDLRALPLETASAGSSPWFAIIATIAAIASAAAVGGAAWYARRRRWRT